MSRGSGRIEQGIIAAFTAEPDNAFTVAELCDRIYPDVGYVDKKHRVAIIRAAQSLSRRWPDLGWQYSETLGRQKVFFNADSVMSWAMARLKGDRFEGYDGNQDPRQLLFGGSSSEEELRTSLLKGGKNHKHIVKGGAWLRHRDMWVAKRDGDTARLKELEAEQERDLAGLSERFAVAFDKTKPQGTR